MSNKNIKKNYIYNLIFQFLIIVLPLITTPYLSRILGAENIGIFSYTLSIVTYFGLFGSLGITMLGQREIAYVQDDIEKRSIKFYELLIIKTFSMLIAIAVFTVIFSLNNQYEVYYRILILELVANILDISWLYQGMENFKIMVMKNSLIKIIGVVCIFIFVKSNDDLVNYFLIYTVFNVLGNLVLWFRLNKYITKVSLKKINCKEFIVPIFTLLVPQIAMQIYTVLDKTMIGKILNDMNEVGYYEQSQKIVKTALMVITTFSVIMIPRMSQSFSKGKKNEIKSNLSLSFNLTFFLAMPMVFGIIAVADNFVPWFYGAGFSEVTTLLKIFSPIILFIGISSILGIQYLVPINKQNMLTKSVLAASIINVILNFILIPIYKSYGGAIASVIAELTVCIIMYVLLRKEIDFKAIFKMAVDYLISGILMFLIIILLTHNLKACISTTVIQLFIGCVSYIIILIILKNDFVLIQIKLLLAKMKKIKK